MKLFLVFVFGGILMSSNVVNAVDGVSLYEQKVKNIDGKEQSFADFKGKPILIVNIATQCGYTPQLDGLEKLYKTYSPKGLVIVGVPSNDFGGQTPEKENDVQKFCKLRYGVTFPLTAKTAVIGVGKHPLYQFLLGQSVNKKEVKWNFEKFFVDKNGKVIQRFESSVKPDDKELVSLIEKSL